MNNETPFGPLESLVGRTFERDGEVVHIEAVFRGGETVAWKEKDALHPWWVSRHHRGPENIIAWLSGATEVKDE